MFRRARPSTREAPYTRARTTAASTTTCQATDQTVAQTVFVTWATTWWAAVLAELATEDTAAAGCPPVAMAAFQPKRKAKMAQTAVTGPAYLRGRLIPDCRLSGDLTTGPAAARSSSHPIRDGSTPELPPHRHDPRLCHRRHLMRARRRPRRPVRRHRSAPVTPRASAVAGTRYRDLIDDIPVPAAVVQGIQPGQRAALIGDVGQQPVTRHHHGDGADPQQVRVPPASAGGADRAVARAAACGRFIAGLSTSRVACYRAVPLGASRGSAGTPAAPGGGRGGLGSQQCLQ